MAVITYKCPNCGGALSWEAEKQKWVCAYCRSEFAEPELAKMRPQNAETASVYSCPSCGAQIMTDETTAATFCYYCHNPVVLSDRLSGDKLPDCVIPFEIDQKKAREIFLGWMKRHRYIPGDFCNEKQISHLSGVYFPYWIYNCRVDGNVEGTGRKLRTWVAGGLQFTETSVYSVEKSGVMDVENVSRIALKKASRVLCEGIMPFQMEKLRTFSAGYLQGFSAEMRDIERDGLSEEVETEVREFAKISLRQSAEDGYTGMEVKSLDAKITDENWRYGLFPVWTMTYTDPKTGKLYYFSVNGQTGKTCGELPVDGKRLFLLFVTVFVPVLILFLLFFYFLL